MDIYRFIRHDNNRLYDLIEDASDSLDIAMRKMVFNRIAGEVIRQADAKADLFYIHLTGVPVSPTGTHLSVLHIRQHIAAIKAVQNDDAAWLARFEILRIAYLAHLENEERHVFTAARKKLTPEQAEDILCVLEERKLMARTSVEVLAA